MKASARDCIWISENDVASVMDMRGAIQAVEQGVAAEARGDATAMLKTHAEWAGGTLHAIGAVFPKAGFAGTKTWTHTPGGAAPLLILFDSENGKLNAVIEAFKLGSMRTAAASGVATRWLSDESADCFAIIGTGKQAFTQVEAILAVRRVRQVRVFSPSPEHRSQFAGRLRTAFGVEVVVSSSVAEAVSGASIITTVTRSKEPFLRSEMIARGTHINAVGAILPGRAEVGPDVVSRCTQIVSDSPAQAQRLSSELIGQLGANPKNWSRVQSLGHLVEAKQKRRVEDDLTLLKSLGTGVLDLSVGIEVYRKVVSAG
jgi:ornithine cyclodeaminase